MPDDPLVDRLVADLRPVRPRRTGREAMILAGLGAAELAAFLAVGLGRPDLSIAMLLMSFWWKLGSVAAIALVAGAAALASFSPGVSPRPGLRAALVAVVLALATGWVLDAARAGEAHLLARLDWRQGLGCVAKMVALSLPAIAAFGVLMRAGAPTDRRGSAIAVGLASGGFGAAVFVLACPSDDPLYLAVWYGVALAIVTLAARFVLPRLSRW